MRLYLLPLLSIGLSGVMVLTSLHQANANTPLNRAEIQTLRNFVQLIQRASRNKRPARPADAITPGDGLSTGRASLADLRFNDGSLARVGEQTVFQFMPRTRNFRLSNGTVLLLIPPGRGQTRIQTPSATAAIRGSALFIRYDQKTDTTVIGALTNSGIAVSNKNASQTQPLQAGQLLLIVKGEFRGLYDFDLRNFYETSELAEGLDLTGKNSSAVIDPTFASVQAEIMAALATQSPLVGEGVVENPAFLNLTTSSSEVDDEEDSTAEIIPNDVWVDNLVETGEILFNNAQQRTNGVSDNPNNNPPDTSENPDDGAQGGSENPDDSAQGGNENPDDGAQGGNENPDDSTQGGSENPDDSAQGGNENPDDSAQGGNENPDDSAQGGNENPDDSAQGGSENPDDEIPPPP